MERIRHPEIAPIELADVWVDGTTLWESIQGGGFSSAVGKVFEAFLAGGSVTHSKEPVPTRAPGFDALFLTGGRVEDKALRAGLSELPCKVVFGEEIVFGGARGGF